MRRLGSVLPALSLLAGCTGLSEEQNRQFLAPPTAPLTVDPMRFGISYEDASIEAGRARLHGWFLPAAAARGPTVLVLHGGRADMSRLHPYYRFLHDAGYHVFVFDYRGFGNSTGVPGVRASFYDMTYVLDWLRDRPEVDPDRIAYYGLSLGATIALHSAAKYATPAALVLEGPISPVDHLQQRFVDEGQDGATSALRTYALQFTGLPQDTEPDDNAGATFAPMLVMSGEKQTRSDRLAALRTYVAARGPKELWILDDTGPAPHSLMTYDGEYQRTVLEFLESALRGERDALAVDWEVSGSGAAGTWVDATVRRPDGPAAEPWAVQFEAIDEKGRATLHNVWLEGAEGTFRFAATGEPALLVARRFRQVLGSEDGSGWLPQPGPLARAGRIWNELAEDVDVLLHGKPDRAEVTRIAARIEGHGELPEALEARLCGAFFAIGNAIDDPAESARWLQRCVDAAPADPETWYWPDLEPIWGFPFVTEVATARQMLQSRS